MIDKKYYSISEVSEKTGLSHSRLREAEKYNPLLRVKKIRDRRYYSSKNIDYILEMYSNAKSYVENSNNDIIQQIDILLSNFKRFI